MKNNRRKFIQTAGAFAAGTLILPQFGCNSPQTDAAKNTAAKVMTPKGSINEFGIQLYTLRDDFPKDPKGVLKQVADLGFKQIEGYEGKEGLFWGMSNLDFKKYIDDLGMKIVSSHCNIKSDFEKKAEQAAEIGMEYLVCPWVGPQKSMDDWKKILTNLMNVVRFVKSMESNSLTIITLILSKHLLE